MMVISIRISGILYVRHVRIWTGRPRKQVTATRKTMKKYKTCIQCGEPMPTRRSKYCSDKCMKIFYTFQYHVAHFEPARMRNCKVCGKVFPAYKLTDRFCSIKCRNNHYVYNWRKRNKIREWRKCEICGSEFLAIYKTTTCCKACNIELGWNSPWEASS